MNEHSFVKKVHAKLPASVYRWKIHDSFTNGVPDAWYSGTRGDLWAEYKFLPRTPVKEFTVPLTPLQLKWLTDREAEGRNVVVIVGTPAGTRLLKPSECQTKVQVTNWLDIDEVIKWITKTVS